MGMPGSGLLRGTFARQLEEVPFETVNRSNVGVDGLAAPPASVAGHANVAEQPLEELGVAAFEGVGAVGPCDEEPPPPPQALIAYHRFVLLKDLRAILKQR